MSHYLQIDKKLNIKYPGLSARIKAISGVKVVEKEDGLEEYKAEIINKIKNRWKIDDLKEDPVFRAYRDFFWRVKVDPTKNRPA